MFYRCDDVCCNSLHLPHSTSTRTHTTQLRLDSNTRTHTSTRVFCAETENDGQCKYKYVYFFSRPDERSSKIKIKRGKRRMKSISRRIREQNTFTNYMRCIIPVYFFFSGCLLRLCFSLSLSFFPHLVADMLFSFSFIITYFISLYLFEILFSLPFPIALCARCSVFVCALARLIFVSFLFFSDAVFFIFVFHLCPCSVMVDLMIYKIVCDFCPASETGTERIYCSEAAHNVFFSLSMFHTFVCDGQVDY